MGYLNETIVLVDNLPSDFSCSFFSFSKIQILFDFIIVHAKYVNFLGSHLEHPSARAHRKSPLIEGAVGVEWTISRFLFDDYNNDRTPQKDFPRDSALSLLFIAKKKEKMKE